MARSARYRVHRMDANLLERYADLIVSVGANVQPGQVLTIEALPEAQPLVAALARARLRPRRALRRRPVLRSAGEADPGRARVRSIARLGAAVARPADRGARRARRGAGRARPARPTRPPRRRRPGACRARPPADAQGDLQDDRRPLDRLDVVAVPDRIAGRRWSIPDTPADEALELLWHDIAHVCRLDEPDPAAAWTERIDQIWQVASRLDGARRSTRSTSRAPGRISPSACCRARASRRRAGRRRRAPAIRHVPNIPTEEVYTTPDPERTKGVVDRDEAARRRRLARHRPAHPLRGRARGRDRRRHERRRRCGTLRDRRRRVTTRRGRARRPREPHRQARPTRSSRRCSTRTPRVTSRSATPTRLRSAIAADLPRINASVGAHRLHDRLGRRRRSPARRRPARQVPILRRRRLADLADLVESRH